MSGASPSPEVWVDQDVMSVIDTAVKAFEEAGAKVEQVDIQFQHSQTQLSEVWRRLVSVANLRILAHLKTKGIDLLNHHAEDLPLAAS